MKLVELYTLLSGDYEGTLERMCSERLVERFVLRFLGDETFPALEKAMAKENYQDAFHIAHNLKGVASNLGLTKLHKVADGLTEALRDGKKPEDDTLLLQVKEEYERTIAALKKFQGAEQQP